MATIKTVTKRQPNTKLQQLAQVENYALFQLQGMLGNLASVHKVPYLYTEDLKSLLEGKIELIKESQQLRKKSK